MRKTMSRRRVGQSDIELRLSCLAEQNFLNMPVFEGKAEQNRLYAAAQRERARRKKLLNLRFKRALVAVCMMLLLIGTGAGAYGSIIGYNGVIYEDTDEFTARGFVPDCFRLPYDMLDKFASEKSFAFTLNNECKIRDIIFKYINENDYLIFNIWNSDSEKFDEDQLVPNPALNCLLIDKIQRRISFMKSKKLFFTLFVAVFMAAALLFLFVGNVANVYASQTQETINWNMKDVWQNKTSRDVPAFATYDAMIECAPRAGFTALGFYDYEYPELLTGDVYEGTNVVNNSYYAFYDEYKELMELMKQSSTGVTVRNFKKGLTEYVERRGRSVTFTSVMSKGTADLTQCIFAFAAQKPVVMFLDGFRYVMRHEEVANRDTITYYTEEDVKHAVLVYGHILFTYDYTTRREYYLVNSGYRGNVKMPIDSFLDVDDAYIIDIT